jgi:hypothetical protein
MLRTANIYPKRKCILIPSPKYSLRSTGSKDGSLKSLIKEDPQFLYSLNKCLLGVILCQAPCCDPRETVVLVGVGGTAEPGGTSLSFPHVSQRVSRQIYYSSVFILWSGAMPR